MIYCYTKDRLWQIWILYVRNSCFNILQTCCLQNCCTLNRFFLKWKILYPKIIKAKTKHPALVHPWMHCSHSSLQTLTISNTKYAVVGHLLHSELPTIAARIFSQVVQAKAENKQIGSQVYWKIFNQILNRGKAFVLIIINGCMVISFLSD